MTLKNLELVDVIILAAVDSSLNFNQKKCLTLTGLTNYNSCHLIETLISKFYIALIVELAFDKTFV